MAVCLNKDLLPQDKWLLSNPQLDMANSKVAMEDHHSNLRLVTVSNQWATVLHQAQVVTDVASKLLARNGPSLLLLKDLQVVPLLPATKANLVLRCIPQS
jgi:uncharacterized Zn ribbon protein